MRFMNALKVQGTLAQGNALGCKIVPPASPCKGRIKGIFTLPLQGVIILRYPNPARWAGL